MPFLLFLLFFLFKAILVAYGSSQARGRMGAAAASLCHSHRNAAFGVPVVAQWLTNPTRNHEVAGSVPAFAQWVNDPLLP